MGSARGEVLSRQLPARRSLRCDLNDIDGEQSTFVSDGGFVRVSLARPRIRVA